MWQEEYHSKVMLGRIYFSSMGNAAFQEQVVSTTVIYNAIADDKHIIATITATHL